ncbi:MAG: hypothetical protein OEY07_14680 [Gammaproteobacteria bacterium]|nr:hypothetical protein [Gammaproteobacteria bacterium]
MEKIIQLEGRDIRISLSNRAIQALQRRHVPLLVELELYFSCLIRKRVIFSDTDRADGATSVTDNLNLLFRPVMSRACQVDNTAAAPDLIDFPLANKQAVVPGWVNIDYRRGQWLGEFGYAG